MVARELEDVRAARTLEEVLESLQAVHSALDSLGIFEAVEINIDRGDAVLLRLGLLPSMPPAARCLSALKTHALSAYT